MLRRHDCDDFFFTCNVWKLKILCIYFFCTVVYHFLVCWVLNVFGTFWFMAHIRRVGISRSLRMCEVKTGTHYTCCRGKHTWMPLCPPVLMWKIVFGQELTILVFVKILIFRNWAVKSVFFQMFFVSVTLEWVSMFVKFYCQLHLPL